MTEEIDKHVLKKYEIQQKLGKGVSLPSIDAITGNDQTVWWFKID